MQFAIPGICPKTFAEVLEVVRKFASSPVMAAELAKLKSNGTSQHMFPMTENTSKPICRQFSSRGTCRFGATCKFTHTDTPGNGGSSNGGSNANSQKSNIKCAFCYNKGHTDADCRKRQAQLHGLPTAHSTPTTALQVSTLQESKDEEIPIEDRLPAVAADPFNMMVRPYSLTTK